MTPALNGFGSSTVGDSVKFSNSVGVDEHDKPWDRTFPNRKGGNSVSELVDLGGMLVVE